MKFRENFSAEDDARLTPCEDDKPKVAEISPFQAGSDYLLSVSYYQHSLPGWYELRSPALQNEGAGLWTYLRNLPWL